MSFDAYMNGNITYHAELLRSQNSVGFLLKTDSKED